MCFYSCLLLHFLASTHYFSNILKDATLDIYYMLLSLYGLLHYAALAYGYIILLFHHVLLLHRAFHHGHLMLYHFIMLYFSMLYLILGIYSSAISVLSILSLFTSSSLWLFITSFFIMLFYQATADTYCNTNQFPRHGLHHQARDQSHIGCCFLSTWEAVHGLIQYTSSASGSHILPLFRMLEFRMLEFRMF